MISLQVFCKLIFFSFLLVTGCHQEQRSGADDIKIIWKEERAAGISLPHDLINSENAGTLKESVEVRLAREGIQPAIAGDFSEQGHEIIFQPLIPFTRGLRYALYIHQKRISEFEIPKDKNLPELLAIFPSQDSLPENLLKIYLQFSRPMMEGHSLSYIKLVNDKGDSLPQIFLPLTSELWNEDGTILTVWLDPGRIKRELIPNKLLGPPMVMGKKYKLVVSGEWPDAAGTSLTKSTTKDIIAIRRDTLSPTPDSWKLVLPKAGTKDPLLINLGEALDYLLLENTIQLIDPQGTMVKGSVQIEGRETIYHFIPAKPWTAGEYKIQIETRLADLAGNNLNRPFDLDLLIPGATASDKNYFEKKFRIQ